MRILKQNQKEHVDRLTKYMQEHCNVYVSVEVIAEFLNVHRSTLYRNIPVICQVAPIEYKPRHGLTYRPAA